MERFKIDDDCPFFERNRELIVASRLTGSRTRSSTRNKSEKMDARRPVDNRFTLIVLDPTGRLSVIKRLKLERVFEEVCEAEARSRGLKAAESIMRRARVL